MSKILIIAEKPSVARDIGKVLKSTKRADGYIYGDKYLITWAVGHLVTLKNPDEYNKSLKKWRFKTLPIIPDKMQTKVIKRVKKQYKIVENLINKKEVESIICATDSGREGELIFRYIYDKSGTNKSFKRLWISSMTDKAIKKGFDTLKDGTEYDNLYKSAKCRAEADWLVGINATRIFTLKYNILLTIGRVQTPTLAILAERQKEIDEFKPEDYYRIMCHKDEFKAKWTDIKNDTSKIADEKKAIEIKNKVKGQDFEVFSVKKQKRSKSHKRLYDLTALQRDANKKYGFSAKKTLKLAQTLYESKKALTYPRTDSRYLSDDMKDVCKETLRSLNNDIYREYLMKLENIKFNNRIINTDKVTDHHAIIPTDNKINTKKLSKDEFKIYDLVARRFISVFFPPYKYESTEMIFDCKEEKFIAKGKVIKDLGWKELYKDEKEDKKLPDLKKGDKISFDKIELEKKKTRPPKYYTEATILSAMENAGRFVEEEEIKESIKESGLGTPATRANILEKLIKVGYIKREKKNLTVTQKGMKLISVVPDELKSPETTGKWEKGLNLIAKGEMERERFMNSIKRYVNYLTSQIPKLNTKIKFENKKLKKKGIAPCPKCDGQIFENSKAYFCSNWRNGCKFNIWKNVLTEYNYNITKKNVETLIKEGSLSKKINVVMPQTREKASADVVFENDKVKLKNIKREE